MVAKRVPDASREDPRPQTLPTKSPSLEGKDVRAYVSKGDRGAMAPPLFEELLLKKYSNCHSKALL